MCNLDECNSAEARCLYVNRFPNRHLSDKKTFQRLDERLWDTGYYICNFRKIQTFFSYEFDSKLDTNRVCPFVSSSMKSKRNTKMDITLKQNQLWHTFLYELLFIVFFSFFFVSYSLVKAGPDVMIHPVYMKIIT